MTKTEVDRFRRILTARSLNWSASRASGTGSWLSGAPINWKRSKRLHNAPSPFVTSTENSPNFETRVRHFVASRTAASAHARSVMKTSIRSGLPPCRGPHFVYGARKP